MSNYSKITNFSIKDALSAGDPSKIIYGTDIDNELNAISTAIATKIQSDSTPTWAGTHTFSLVASLLAFPIKVSSALPGILFDETDGGANTRYWRDFVNAGFRQFDVTDDAGASPKAWMIVGRTANAVSSMQFGNATDNPTYTFAGTGVTTVNGAVTVKGAINLFGGSSTALGSTLVLQGTSSPGLSWSNTSASADNKNWDMYADTSGVLHGRIVNDAVNSSADWMTVIRSGMTVSSINLQATAVQIGGSGALKANLSGSVTVDFGSIAAGAAATTSLTVTGAAAGDPIAVGCSVNPVGLQPYATVSSANTVTVGFFNYSTGAVDPASATFKVTVFH